jgi:RNA polymerase sigma factor (TIGR02999 family)
MIAGVPKGGMPPPRGMDAPDRRAPALLDTLYVELRRQAEHAMRGQPAGHTLQPTALVHEAYLKLAANSQSWADRTHFLATAAKAMRHVLIDHARKRNAEKRRARGEEEPLDGLLVAYEDHALNLLALDEALARLEEFDPELARAVELRFFGGLSLTECARTLGMSQRTFERRWVATRTWLYAQLS